MKSVLWCLVLIGVAAQGLRADTIILKNGDRLSGTITELRKNKLTLKSPLLGEMMIALSSIQTFTTDQPFEARFQDGTTLTGKIEPGEEGRITLRNPDDPNGVARPLGDLTLLKPTTPPAPRWHGAVAAGFNSIHGNTFTNAANLSATTKLRRRQDRVTGSTEYIVSRDRNPNTRKEYTTEETFTGGGQYDYFLTQKLYAFGNGNYKKDHVADLDRRLLSGLGLGIQWAELQHLEFATDVGVAELQEKYIKEVAGDSQITQNDELSMQVGYKLDWMFLSRFNALHNLRIYPAVGGIADYYLTADAELRAALNQRLFLSFKTQINYDTTPAKGSATTDTRYLVGVGLNY